MSWMDMAQIVFFGAKVFFVLVIAGLILRFAVSLFAFLIVAPTAFLLGLAFMAISFGASVPRVLWQKLRSIRKEALQLPKNVLQFRRTEKASL